MKSKFVAATLICAAIPAFAQTGPGWAWTAGKITNNGSVTVKSANGVATYSAVKDPIGAVAKINQSAVTQPPTVIIQATSSASQYTEAVPVISTLANSSSVLPVPPACPIGYTAVWTKAMASNARGITFNVSGTRFSFGMYQYGSTGYIGWIVDAPPSAGSSANFTIPELGAPYNSYHVAGTLCTK